VLASTFRFVICWPGLGGVDLLASRVRRTYPFSPRRSLPFHRLGTGDTGDGASVSSVPCADVLEHAPHDVTVARVVKLTDDTAVSVSVDDLAQCPG
jgi:hypothetical protein